MHRRARRILVDKIEHLMEAMRRLAACQELRTRFGREGRKHTEHNFSRAILAKNTQELYAAILQRP